MIWLTKKFASHLAGWFDAKGDVVCIYPKNSDSGRRLLVYIYFSLNNEPLVQKLLTIFHSAYSENINDSCILVIKSLRDLSKFTFLVNGKLKTSKITGINKLNSERGEI